MVVKHVTRGNKGLSVMDHYSPRTIIIFYFPDQNGPNWQTFCSINPLPLADYEPEWPELGRFHNLVKLLFKNTYINFMGLDVSIETGPSRIMHCQVGYGREWVTTLFVRVVIHPSSCSLLSIGVHVCLSMFVYFQILSLLKIASNI
jgi:hypothetical protein